MTVVLLMEARDEMAMSGVPSYYMRPGLDGSAYGSQPGFHSLPEMRSFSDPFTSHSIDRATICGGGTAIPAMQLEAPSPSPSPSPLPPHAMNVISRGGGMALGEPEKRKRGRPRKYWPDGATSLGLVPSSSPEPGPAGGISGTPMPTEKRRRGRPPGTGRKQQLASYGELQILVISLFLFDSWAPFSHFFGGCELTFYAILVTTR